MGLYFEKALINEIRCNETFSSIVLSVLYGHIKPKVYQFIVLDHSHRTSLPLLIFGAQGCNNFFNLIQNLFGQLQIVKCNGTLFIFGETELFISSEWTARLTCSLVELKIGLIHFENLDQ